jgi:hypothetical protein
MGIVLVVGMMLYSVGMCVLFDRVTRRSRGIRRIEVEDGPPLVVVVPDHVPAEWVDAYRADQGG